VRVVLKGKSFKWQCFGFLQRMEGDFYVKVTRKGQVTIPLVIRKALGIKEGDILAVREEGGRVVLEKVGLPEPGEPVGQEAYEELVKELERVRGAWR